MGGHVDGQVSELMKNCDMKGLGSEFTLLSEVFAR